MELLKLVVALLILFAVPVLLGLASLLVDLIMIKIYKLLSIKVPFSIKVPLFGYRFSNLSILLCFASFPIALYFVFKIFGGDN